ncbi:MAG: rod-binding protein [Fervidobacterium sp.]
MELKINSKVNAQIENIVKITGKKINTKQTLEDNQDYQNKLKKVSEEFAAWYVYEIFKKMYSTVPKSGLIQESFGERWFREILLQQYALKAARTDLKDLSEIIYKSLGGKVTKNSINSSENLENKVETLKLLNSLISQDQKSGQ